jgi:Mor family transcriptional regulator
MFGSDSDDLGALFVPTEKRANFGRKNVEEFVREIVAPEKAFGKEEAKKVQKRILEFYLAEKGEGVEFYLRKYNDVGIGGILKLIWELILSCYRICCFWCQF